MKQTTGKQQDANIAVLMNNIEYIKSDVADIRAKLESNYATKEWCESKFGQTTKLVNILMIALGTGLVSAFVVFIVNGGLKVQ